MALRTTAPDSRSFPRRYDYVENWRVARHTPVPLDGLVSGCRRRGHTSGRCFARPSRVVRRNSLDVSHPLLVDLSRRLSSGRGDLRPVTHEARDARLVRLAEHLFHVCADRFDAGGEPLGNLARRQAFYQ